MFAELGCLNGECICEICGPRINVWEAYAIYENKICCDSYLKNSMLCFPLRTGLFHNF